MTDMNLKTDFKQRKKRSKKIPIYRKRPPKNKVANPVCEKVLLVLGIVTYAKMSRLSCIAAQQEVDLCV